MKMFIWLLALSTILTGCGNDSESKPESQLPAKAQSITQISPEDVVVFSDSTVACLTRDGLQEIVAHMVKGEATKANALMLDPKHPKGECIMLSSGTKYKVLSSEYNDPALPDVGLLELVGEGNNSGEGAWAFSIGATKYLR